MGDFQNSMEIISQNLSKQNHQNHGNTFKKTTEVFHFNHKIKLQKHRKQTKFQIAKIGWNKIVIPSQATCD